MNWVRVRRSISAVSVAMLVASALVAAPAAAGAAPAPGQGDRVGLFDPATARWDLQGVGSFLYGDPGDQPLMGDWNCDGTDTPGLYRRVDTAAGPAGKVYLRNSNTTGIADIEYFYGDPQDRAVAGDWDGDGCDTVSLFRPRNGTIYVSNRLGSAGRGIGAADSSYTLAGGVDVSAAVPVAGDFDGDGVDTVALHLPATGTVLGVRAAAFTFGDPGDQLLVGAWTGGIDVVGVYRPSTGGFLLAGSNQDVVAAQARSIQTSNGIAVSYSPGPVPFSGHSPSSDPSSDSNDYAVIASNSTEIKRGSVVSGSVAVNTAAPGLVLDGGVEVDVDQSTSINGDVAANRLVLGRNSTVSGDGFYQTSIVVNAGATVGGPFQVPGLLPVVTPPAFQAAAPGAAPVVVGPGGATLPAGSYGALTLGGPLTLTGGGTFDFASVSPVGGGGNCAFPCRSLVADAPSVVRVAGRLDVGQRALVGTTAAAMVSPWDIVFHVGGTNLDPSNPNSLPPAATVGRSSRLDAVVIAPNGTLLIDRDSTGAGQAVGRDVRIDTGVNFRLPPRANDVAVSVFEDEQVAGSFDASTSDGSALTYFIVSGPAKGTVTNNGDGTFTFDPDGDFDDLDGGESEDVTFTYRAKDPQGVASNTANVTVTVLGANVVAVDDQYDGFEDVVLAVPAPGVLSNDIDPRGDATVVPIVNGHSALGALVNAAADGSFTYDPNGQLEYLAVGESVVDSFEYTAQNALPPSSATVFVTVAGANDPPSANDQEASTSGSPIVITLTGGDVDKSDDLFFSIDSGPTAGSLGPVSNVTGGVNKNTATVEYTPATGDPLATFTFKADDGNGLSDIGTVTINRPPEGNANPPGVAGVDAKPTPPDTQEEETVTGSPKTITLVAAAPDSIADLEFTILTQPPAGEGVVSVPTPIVPNGSGVVRSATVTYDPQSFGPASPSDPPAETTFTFEACDAATGTICDTAVINVSVGAPTPASPPLVTNVGAQVVPDSSVFFDLLLGGDQTGSQPPPDPGVGRALPAGSTPGVYFAIDETGSMGSSLAAVKTTVVSVIGSLNTAFPGIEFGLGKYRDFPSTSNSYQFQHLVSIGADDGIDTGDTGDVSNVISTLAAGEGGDLPEGQFYALDQLMSSHNPGGFDESQVNVVVLIGDAPAHDPVCGAISGLNYDISEGSVVSKLLEPGWLSPAGLGGVKLVTFESSAASGGLNASPAPAFNEYAGTCSVGGSAGQATRMTDATGGSHLVGHGTEPATAGDLTDAIAEAIDPAAQFTITITQLPTLGTLFDSNGNPITVVGQLIPGSKVTYVPLSTSPVGSVDQFGFEVKDNTTLLTTSAFGYVAIVAEVAPGDECVIVGRPPGCGL